MLSGSRSTTDNNNDVELSDNFNAKHNNESTVGNSFTDVSFICPPTAATLSSNSKFIKKESYDD